VQTIAAFASKALAAVGHAAVAGAQAAGHAVMTVGRAVASQAPHAAQAASSGSKILQGLRIGTSVVSALSTFQQAQMQSQAMQAEAGDEALQARQEFVQSQERATAIQVEFNRLVEAQLAYAGAAGIDVNSGSVTEARQQAQADADRQIAIDRNSTYLNAALRRSRARGLRANAQLVKQAGFASGLVKGAEGYIDARKIG
jgi:hypothetical protein